MPTDVPVGAAPRPIAPLSVRISTSTAGRHLQSMICCARTDTILSSMLLTPLRFRNVKYVQVTQVGACVTSKDSRTNRIECLEATVLTQRLIQTDPFVGRGL